MITEESRLNTVSSSEIQLARRFAELREERYRWFLVRKPEGLLPKIERWSRNLYDIREEEETYKRRFPSADVKIYGEKEFINEFFY